MQNIKQHRYHYRSGLNWTIHEIDCLKQLIFICCYLFIFFLAISVITTVEAKEITVQHKGLTINAKLELADGHNLTDGVMIITHGGLAHNGMESIVYFQRLFKERGYNTLAINLSLGLNNRKGMYDCKVTHRHQNDDAIDEVDVWVAWIKEQGVKHVTLFAHSRGGAQTALYVVERDNALIKSLVLLAPATRDNGAAGYQQRYKKPLAPLLAKAQQLIKDGKGDSVLDHAVPCL